MSRRDDLLELTPQALTALANAGFVKRAQREVAAGQVPTLSIDAQGVVTAAFDDGVETRFPPNVGLSDASCTCPASGMCRHRVTLVLAWQAAAQGAQGGAEAGAAAMALAAASSRASAEAAAARDADPATGSTPASADLQAQQAMATAPTPVGQPTGAEQPAAASPPTAPAAMPAGEAFSPADFDDAQLTAALGATALAQATRFAAQQPTVRVQPWQGAQSPPVARLPMCTVRFFSRHSLNMARCDCVAGGRCAHVALAVWAFRQARPEAGGDERVLTLRGPVAWGDGAPAALPVDASGAGQPSAKGDAASDAALDAPKVNASRAKTNSGTSTQPKQSQAGNAPEEAQYAVRDEGGDAFGLRSEAGLRVRAGLDALLRQLWLDGAAQPQLALAGRFTALRTELQTLGWQWVLDALDELEHQVHALMARSTRFDAARLLAVSAELWARCRCAERQWQVEHQSIQSAGSGHAGAGAVASHEALTAAEVLGRGVRGEVALDHLRLVSLGGTLWRDLHEEGASVFLADPDTQSLLVLERAWPNATDAAAASATAAGSGPVAVGAFQAGTAQAEPSLLQRRVVGVPLRQLMASQVITKAAKRRANGVVDIGGTKRQTGVLPLSPQAWQALAPPLLQVGIAALHHQLLRQPPAFAAPRHAIGGATAGVSGSLHVLQVHQAHLQQWWWDGAAQCVHAIWRDAPSGSEDALGDADAPVLHVQLPYRPEAPGAVDALAKALGGEWGAVQAMAGVAWRANGQVCLHPTALVCAQQAVVLAAHPATGHAMPPVGTMPEATLREAALAQALTHLGHLLRDGLRHQGGLWRQTLQAHQSGLHQAGFAQAAQLLGDVPQEAHSRHATELPSVMSRLTLLLRELQAH